VEDYYLIQLNKFEANRVDVKNKNTPKISPNNIQHKLVHPDKTITFYINLKVKISYFKVILYSYLILKKMNEHITDS